MRTISISRRPTLRPITLLLVVILIWTLGACADTDTPATNSSDVTPQIPPELAGTDVEQITGTVRKVSGLEFYRDSENNYEITHRPVTGTSMYVIVPEYDDSLELVPLELIDFLTVQRASKTAKLDELGIPAYLVRSSVPESFAEDGLRVVFSGAVGSTPVVLEGLNRVPLRLTEIEAASVP